MDFVGVDPASLVWCHDEVGECVDVVCYISQSPTFNLDGAGVEVFDLDVFIGFVGTNDSIEENGSDLDVAGNNNWGLGGAEYG